MEAADRPPAWSHPQQHGGFHLESFGLFLCKLRILEGQQHRAVSHRQAWGKKTTKPQSKGSLNLVRLRMLHDGFEQLSFNLISWQKKKK